MQRRTLLRRGGSAFLATVTLGPAGCSTSGDNGGSDDPTTDDGSDGPGPPLDEVTNDAVDGLDIVAAGTYDGSTDNSFLLDAWAAEVTIENVGDRKTAPMEYAYDQTVYDDADRELCGGGRSRIVTFDSDVAPGETSSVVIQPHYEAEVDSEAVARHEVSMTCGPLSDGVYCER